MRKSISALLAAGFAAACLTSGVSALDADNVKEMLTTPEIISIEEKFDEDNIPYFQAQIYIASSIENLDTESPDGGSVFWEWSVKIDDGEWSAPGGGGYADLFFETEEAAVSGADDTYYADFDLLDEGTIDTIDIEQHQYTYRVRFYYDYYEGWPDVDPIYSEWSNELSIGSSSFESGTTGSVTEEETGEDNTSDVNEDTEPVSEEDTNTEAADDTVPNGDDSSDFDEDTADTEADEDNDNPETGVELNIAAALFSASVFAAVVFIKRKNALS